MRFLSARTLACLALSLVALTGAVSGTAQAQDAPKLAEPGSQRLVLAPGPNLVSLYIYPDDLSLDALFSSVQDDGFMVKDEGSRVYYPALGIRGVDRWTWTQSHVVYVGDSLSIDLSGRLIDPSTEIALGAGWQQVSFLGQEAVPVEEGVASIASSLTTIQDEDGRAYPTAGAGGLLTSLEPGRGYRLRMSRADTLSWAPAVAPPPAEEPPAEEPPAEEPPASDVIRVNTLDEALALNGLQQGDVVEISDPIRGGTFEVTDSGRPTDGGTVFVPLEYSAEASTAVPRTMVTLYDGPNDGGIVFDSFQLYYGLDGDFVDATYLHGHGSNLGETNGAPRLDSRTGRVNLLHFNNLGALSVFYRYATSTVRLERSIPRLTLEGVPTTDYVRPEWWGAQPYPTGWTPDATPPPAPGATPTGIVLGDPTFDSHTRLATAINVAEAKAAATDREHYVVLSGMYAYSQVLELQDRVVLKGERDDVREGQGLRVIKGAPWHYWATNNRVAPAYAESRSVADWAASADPFVVLRHGRYSTLNRVVDVEIDGNLAENGYVLTREYQTASGGGGALYGGNRVQEMLQNTAHWNGFVASGVSGDVIEGSNARLENVLIRDVGGNLILSGEPISFEGSRDIAVRNSARNHVAYRVFSGSGAIDGFDLSGYFWLGGFELQQGTYRNVYIHDLAEDPWDLGAIYGVLGHRNDGLTDAQVAANRGGYYFGDAVVVDGIRMDFSRGVHPSRNLLAFDNGGPVTFRNLTYVGQPGALTKVVYDAGDTRQVERSSFTLENATFDSNGGRGVSLLAPMFAGRTRIQNVTIDRGAQGLFVFRPGYYTFGPQVITVYDVVQQDAASPGTFELFNVIPSVPDHQGATIYISGSTLGAQRMWAATKHPDETWQHFRDVVRLYVRNSTLRDVLPTSNAYYGEDVIVLQRGSRTSTARGELQGRTLTSGAIDVDPGLFQQPADPSFVQVTGPDASRFTGWTNVGSEEDPILRLSFSGSSPVTVGWTAAVNPIPDGVVFPE